VREAYQRDAPVEGASRASIPICGWSIHILVYLGKAPYNPFQWAGPPAKTHRRRHGSIGATKRKTNRRQPVMDSFLFCRQSARISRATPVWRSARRFAARFI